MIEKRNGTPAAAGDQLPANDISTEGPAQHLPALNYLLVREKDMLRSLVHAFAQKFASIAADAERTKLKEEERRREELLQSVTHDMERCLEAISNSAVKLARDREEMNAENKTFASKISAMEEEGKKREESLQSVTHDLVLTKTCLQMKEDLVVRLARELEEVKIRKEKELELLTAENKTLASKVFAFEEGHRCSKQIGDRLRDEVLDERKKEENSTLVAGSEEIETSDLMEEKDLESAQIDELVELKIQRSRLLVKHNFACRMGALTQQKIDELKSKMARKNIVDKKRDEYEIRMSNLVGELAKRKSSERRTGDAYRSCNEKCDIKAAEIASMHRELKMKADEAVDLRLQLKELMKSKQKFELMCNQLQLDLNGLTRENVEMRTHIDYLTAEKASLEKQLETSQEELENVQRTLMASVNASCSVLSKLKKTAAERVGNEGAQDNCIRGHPLGEILVIHGGVGGGAESPSSLARLRREMASSSTRTTEGVGNPYNDAVVIKASIENITVHRVLIDSGSSVNVLYKRAFERMRLDPNTLIPPECPQFDSFGDRWEAEGIVILPVTLGDDRGKYTRMTRFHVFDGPDHYNAIFGRPLLNDFQAVVCTYNLTIQFPADERQVIIRGDVVSARECYLRAVGGLEDSAQSKEGESRN